MLHTVRIPPVFPCPSCCWKISRTSERQSLASVRAPKVLQGGIQLISWTLAEQRDHLANGTFLSLAETEHSEKPGVKQKKLPLDKALHISLSPGVQDYLRNHVLLGHRCSFPDAIALLYSPRALLLLWLQMKICLGLLSPTLPTQGENRVIKHCKCVHFLSVILQWCLMPLRARWVGVNFHRKTLKTSLCETRRKKNPTVFSCAKKISVCTRGKIPS